jgi:hypothetical protein
VRSASAVNPSRVFKYTCATQPPVPRLTKTCMSHDLPSQPQLHVGDDSSLRSLKAVQP